MLILRSLIRSLAWSVSRISILDLLSHSLIELVNLGQVTHSLLVFSAAPYFPEHKIQRQVSGLPHRLLQTEKGIFLVFDVAVHPDGAADENNAENKHVNQSLTAQGFPAKGQRQQ